MKYRLVSKIQFQILNSKNNEVSSFVFKFIRNNYNFYIPYRQKALLLQSRVSKNFNFNRSLNFCLETGKTRFIIKNLKLSRMSLKKFSSSKFLMGYYKSSW